jgi:ectoine hydroxylase-related dioxygenase (phytanoyl-CoA dioxygenase family)
MSDVVSAEQIDRFKRDGVVFPIRVLSPGQADRYRMHSDALESALGGRPRTVEVRQMHLHFRWAYELATHPRVLDAVEAVLGPNLLVWGTELFAKHPRDASLAIAWHRDHPYTGFRFDQLATAWIALADSTPANGCMQVIPCGKEATQDRVADDHVGRAAWPEDACQHNEHALDVVLRAGEMSLHDGYVLHGSGPNRSSQKRVGFTVRFIRPEARPLVGKPPVMLARGRDDHHHFTLVEPSLEEDMPQALAAMKQSADDHLEKMLRTLKLTGHA